MYPELKSAEEFKWKDIDTQGATNLSLAYDEALKEALQAGKRWMMPQIGGVAPIIILMTDGLPTSYDLEEHLTELKKKDWFKVVLKYALEIGIDTDEAMDVLKKYTGNPKIILKVYSAEALRKVIKVITVTISKVKSSSSFIGKTEGENGVKSNNEVAHGEIANRLEDVNDVEW